MRIFGISRSRGLVISILLLFSLSVMAQSNLTYELKIGATAENTLLAEFPDSYAGEKINISLRPLTLLDPDAIRPASPVRPSSGLLDSLDFIFSNLQSPISNHSIRSIVTLTNRTSPGLFGGIINLLRIAHSG